MTKAAESVRTDESKIYGVEPAIVTNNKDPEKIGRIKVCFTRLEGKPESDWIRVIQSHAGKERGWYWVPHVNDEVLVAFERGEPNRGYVIGSLWSKTDMPPPKGYTDKNEKWHIRTKSGHEITFDDTDGKEKITIVDKTGKRSIAFDVKAKKFTIQADIGDVEIIAEKKIFMKCEELVIETSKNAGLKIGGDMNIEVSKKLNAKAGPQINMKASRINLN
jgi:uncharacterized protein involved in type VI secretion and phage assembly